MLLAVGLLALGGHAAIELTAHWRSGLRPTDNAYGAAVYMLLALQVFFAVTIAIMALYTMARAIAGRLHAQRRVTFDNTRLLWYYAAGQGVVMSALLHLFPRLTG